MAITTTQLPSEYISIFPATRRDVVYQKDARHFNEQNVINITNKLTDVDSYVITKTPSSTDIFEFVLHGYYIMVESASQILSIFLTSNPSEIYAYIEIDNGNDYPEIAGQDAEDSTGTVCYYGVKFSNTKPTGSNIYSLLILKKKSASAALSIDNVEVPIENITKFDMDSTEGLSELNDNFTKHSEDSTSHITDSERTNWNNATQRSSTNETNINSLTQNFNTHNSDNTRHITATERAKWNSAYESSELNHRVTDTTLYNGGWQNSDAPFVYELGLSGCTNSAVPEIGANIDANASASAKTIKKNFSYLYKADTGTDKITFYAYKKPTIDIPITIKGA